MAVTCASCTARERAHWILRLGDCTLLQILVDGFQHEQPDYWLNFGNPWELGRLNVAYPISYYGHVSVHEEGGRQIFKWNPGETVWGVGYHMHSCS